ncbi:MAG: hypothetical protein LIO49_03845 [Ruminococcus sp.]|nr:hypothetical protein [Ruminococcus sp.]
MLEEVISEYVSSSSAKTVNPAKLLSDRQKIIAIAVKIHTNLLSISPHMPFMPILNRLI